MTNQIIQIALALSSFLSLMMAGIAFFSKKVDESIFWMLIALYMKP